MSTVLGRVARELSYNHINTIIPKTTGYLITHKSGQSVIIRQHSQLVSQAMWRGLMMRFEGKCPQKESSNSWDLILKRLIAPKMQVSP